jgi:hypothetical protein
MKSKIIIQNTYREYNGNYNTTIFELFVYRKKGNRLIYAIGIPERKEVCFTKIDLDVLK